MNIWLFEISDFVPWVDIGQRPFRCGMLAQALAHAGHSVHWWTSTFNHQLRLSRFPASSTARVADNVHIHFLFGPGYRNSRSITRWLHNRAVAAEFGRYLAQQRDLPKPDLIYACLPTLEVGEQAARVASSLKTPLVVDVRDLHPDNYLTLFPAWARGAIRAALKFEYRRARRILHQASSIVASSDAYLRWGLDLAGRDRSAFDRVFPLGAPDLRGPQTAGVGSRERADGSFVVAFAGTFTDLFDFETVAGAARQLKRTGRHVTFRLIGSGRQLEHVKSMFKGLPDVQFCGWLRHEQLKQQLLDSDVGLAPYSSHIPPTLPNKPFEYMAMGLPLLTCAEGELRSLVEREGVGVHYRFGDVKDLATKIEWLVDNPGPVHTMAARARQLYEEQFDQQIVYAQLVGHLQAVAARGDTAGCGEVTASSVSPAWRG